MSLNNYSLKNIYLLKLIRISIFFFVLTLLLFWIATENGWEFFPKTALILSALFIIFFIRTYQLFNPVFKGIDKLSSLKEETEKTYTDELKLLTEKNPNKFLENILGSTEKKIQNQDDQLQLEHKKIQIILENITDAIVAIDLNFNVLFHNAHFAELFPTNNDNGATKKKIQSFTDDTQIINSIKRCLETEHTIKINHYYFYKLSKNKIFDISFSAIKNDIKLIGVLVSFHDMTETRHAEQMRSDFVANISHDIRTPLTSIQGYAQTLENEAESSSELKYFAQKIRTNSQKLVDLFNELLELSKIENSRSIEYQPVDIKNIVEQTLLLLNPIYAKKNYQLQLNLDCPIVHGEKRLIERVFTNILDNSFKYSIDSIHFRISSKLINGKLHIEIEDNGPGIPKEFHDRVFERFFRVDHSRTIATGSGLGLAIVKHIMQKHNGNVYIDETSRGNKIVLVFENNSV
jgi:two-component system phosphate regulon sensor histidine kinase PhoR